MPKYVCLRDDDTSFFTSPEELIEGYGRYWGQVPITLATVPFSHGSQQKILDVEGEKEKFKALRAWELSATAEQLTEYHKLHPIGDNAPLVAELKKQQDRGMVEIAQHGVSHRYNEFGAETKNTQVTCPMIRDGMEYLSKVFGRGVRTYVPPSNTIDITCARYVHSIGMNLFVSGSISYRTKWGKLAGYLRDTKAVLEKLKNEKYQPIRRRDGIYMFGSFTYDVFKSQDELLSKMKEGLESTGFAALGTHYMLLNKKGYHGAHTEYQECYLGLLDKLQMIEGVEFVTSEKYFSLLMEKYYA